MNLPIDIITTILYNHHNNVQLKSLLIKLEICLNLV